MQTGSQKGSRYCGTIGLILRLHMERRVSWIEKSVCNEVFFSWKEMCVSSEQMPSHKWGTHLVHQLTLLPLSHPRPLVEPLSRPLPASRAADVHTRGQAVVVVGSQTFLSAHPLTHSLTHSFPVPSRTNIRSDRLIRIVVSLQPDKWLTRCSDYYYTPVKQRSLLPANGFHQKPDEFIEFINR